MVAKKKNLSEFAPFKFPSADEQVIGIVVSQWNVHITDSLLNAAMDTLLEHGVKRENIIIVCVPGSFELPMGAQMLINHKHVDGIICIGCVIQGETRHFEFISQAVANGIMQTGLDYSVPVVFSVLTCDTMQQAEERAGGQHGNKGVEGAMTCLKMIALQNEFAEDEGVY